MSEAFWTLGAHCSHEAVELVLKNPEWLLLLCYLYLCQRPVAQFRGAGKFRLCPRMFKLTTKVIRGYSGCCHPWHVRLPAKINKIVRNFIKCGRPARRTGVSAWTNAPPIGCWTHNVATNLRTVIYPDIFVFIFACCCLCTAAVIRFVHPGTACYCIHTST